MKWLLVIWIIIGIACLRMAIKDEKKYHFSERNKKVRRKWNWDTDYPEYS